MLLVSLSLFRLSSMETTTGFSIATFQYAGVLNTMAYYEKKEKKINYYHVNNASNVLYKYTNVIIGSKMYLTVYISGRKLAKIFPFFVILTKQNGINRKRKKQQKNIAEWQPFANFTTLFLQRYIYLLFTQKMFL